STAQITGLQTDDVQALSSGQFAALSTAQLGALTTAQVAAISSEDLSAIGTGGIRAFGSAALHAMDSDQIGALTSAQFGVLSSAQVAGLDTADFAAIGTEDLAALNTAALRALSTDQIQALSSEQFAALGNQQLAALTTAQVSVLQSEDIAALSSAQVAVLGSAQIGALSTDAFLQLDSADITALTTAQVAGLSTAQLSVMTSDQMTGFEAADIAKMNMTQANALLANTDAMSVMTGEQLDALILTSPIVLDLDGNGIQTLSASNGVNFDLNATGNSQKYGWVGGADGLLVMDRNGDGQINSGAELFGNGTSLANGQHAANGYVAMQQEDGNLDGVLNQLDASFKDLRVWVDANHDGKTDAGELKGLAELGIVELNLNAQSSSAVDNGNLVGLVSGYTKADGSSHAMADVWFAKDVAPDSGTLEAPVQLGDVLAAPAAQTLPGGEALGATAAAATSQIALVVLPKLSDDDNAKLSNPLI
ncbi:MAG TPA: heme utilization protein, partial [Roseateles sp.]|nr:heme utilization protein [Roseateles sp.]